MGRLNLIYLIGLFVFIPSLDIVSQEKFSMFLGFDKAVYKKASDDEWKLEREVSGAYTIGINWTTLKVMLVDNEYVSNMDISSATEEVTDHGKIGVFMLKGNQFYKVKYDRTEFDDKSIQNPKAKFYFYMKSLGDDYCFYFNEVTHMENSYGE